MGLANRITSLARQESRYSIDTWIQDYLLPSGVFSYSGHTYPYGGGLHGIKQTLAGGRVIEVTNSLPSYLQALRACPPAYAAQMVRALVLSQVRFTFRKRPSQASNPRKPFGTRELRVLENPWPGATTGEMVSRMEWHSGLTGNAYVHRQPERLRLLRPDWTAVLFGSEREPDEAPGALDGELVGYVYQNGGLFGGVGKPETLLPNEVAHYSPLPDPEMAGIGMSWITPAIREIQGDAAATDHKTQFFKNGATPNLVVKGIPAMTEAQFNEIVNTMEQRHTGVSNAYKTLYLTAGADATVIGSNFRDMDLKNIQGAFETRISVLSRVPASILGIAEGLAGSSLNAGNFGMARRIFADSWIYPTLQDLSMSLADIIEVPSDAELWFDTVDMPILREDAKDAAEIEQLKATTITMYVREGFTAESAIAAVRGQDVNLLKHSGLTSVQLQPPVEEGAEGGIPAKPGAGGADESVFIPPKEG